MVTMFNPADEKYNIEQHFGKAVNKFNNYRSVHIVEARGKPCPRHLQYDFFGNISYFKKI